MSLQDQRFAPDGDAYIYANRQMWEGAAATEHSHNRSPQSSDVVPERRIAADNTSTTHTRQPQIWETAAATEHSESLPIATHALPVNDVKDLKPAEHLENATMRDQRKDKRMRHLAQRCAAEMRRVLFPGTGDRPNTNTNQDHPRPSRKVRGEEICFCRFRSLRPRALCLWADQGRLGGSANEGLHGLERGRAVVYAALCGVRACRCRRSGAPRRGSHRSGARRVCACAAATGRMGAGARAHTRASWQYGA